jgi:TetR/AcrR family transcriptional repressor of uid operon
MIDLAPEETAGATSERSLRRRRQVLDAAQACFRRHGFHAASMSGVATEAGMSVGHIYRYFENKEAIIAAIVERDLEATGELFARIRQAPQGVVAALVDGVEECVDDMADQASAALFLEVMAEAARNPKIANMVASQQDSTRRWLTDLFARGRGAELGREQIEDLVDVLQLLMAGLRLRMVHEPNLDRARMVRLLRKIITATPRPDMDEPVRPPLTRD